MLQGGQSHSSRIIIIIIVVLLYSKFPHEPFLNQENSFDSAQLTLWYKGGLCSFPASTHI